MDLDPALDLSSARLHALWTACRVPEVGLPLHLPPRRGIPDLCPLLLHASPPLPKPSPVAVPPAALHLLALTTRLVGAIRRLGAAFAPSLAFAPAKAKHLALEQPKAAQQGEACNDCGTVAALLGDLE